MNRVYKLIWNNARNMYIAVSEIAKSHRKETLRGGKKSAAIFLAALYLCGTGFAANTVQAESNSPVLTDEQKNEIADKVLEKLKNNENIKILKSKLGIHYFSVKSDDNTSPDGTNWNNDGAIGEKAIAIGSKVKAENRNSISIGEGITKNKGKFGIAIGATGNSGEVAPEVKNEHGIAVGSGTVADSSGIALGLKSKNTTGYAISIGRESE